jgi:hypothetical protein
MKNRKITFKEVKNVEELKSRAVIRPDGTRFISCGHWGPRVQRFLDLEGPESELVFLNYSSIYGTHTAVRYFKKA